MMPAITDSKCVTGRTHIAGWLACAYIKTNLESTPVAIMLTSITFLVVLLRRDTKITANGSTR
jgi:hypothetical protein